MEMDDHHVFGTPEGDRKEKARKALNDPNAEGTEVTTHVSIDNTTGETLSYSLQHSWEGHFIGQIPPTLGNGECGDFSHANEALGNSTGAVVYRAKKKDGSESLCQLLLCWNTPSDKKDSNYHAYCDILDDGSIKDDDDDWKKILNILKNKRKQDSITLCGLRIDVNIVPNANSSSSYKAVLRTPSVGAILAMKPSSEVDDDSSATPTIK